MDHIHLYPTMEDEAVIAVQRDDVEPVRRFLDYQQLHRNDQGDEAAPADGANVWRVIVSAIAGNGMYCDPVVEATRYVCTHPLSREMIESMPFRALHAAVAHDSVTGLTEVLKIVDPNLHDGFALKCAIYHCCPETVEVLLADERTSPNLSEYTPAPIVCALTPSYLRNRHIMAPIICQLLACPRLRIEGKTLDYIVDHIDKIVRLAIMDNNTAFIRPLLAFGSIRETLAPARLNRLLALYNESY